MESINFFINTLAIKLNSSRDEKTTIKATVNMNDVLRVRESDKVLSFNERLGNSIVKKCAVTFSDKLFAKFGFELTFMPTIVLPPALQKDECWEPAFEGYYAGIEQGIKDKLIYHEFTDIVTDAGSMEIRTTPTTDFKKFIDKYKSLCTFLEKIYWVLPSSNICMQSEGGCHINFDVNNAHDNNAYDVKLFANYLVQYINEHPAIVWTFLSPYDNESSAFKEDFENDSESYSKGHFMRLVRQARRSQYGRRSFRGDCEYKRIELRFFMMPRTIEEFELHFDFANKLMLYVMQIFQKATPKDFATDSKIYNLKTLTLQDCVKQVKQVCNDIGFSYDSLVKAGKIDLLKQRLRLGKNYKV